MEQSSVLFSWMDDCKESERTLRRRYADQVDSVTDLRALYEHANEELNAAYHALPSRKWLGDIALEKLCRVVKWEQRHNVLRSMLRERHEPQLPSKKYERRLRAALSAYEHGMGFTDLAGAVAEAPQVDAGRSTIVKALRKAFRDRHGYNGRINATALPELLKQEADHWKIECSEMEEVE